MFETITIYCQVNTKKGLLSDQFQVYETPETARTNSKRYLHSIKATFSITR